MQKLSTLLYRKSSPLWCFLATVTVSIFLYFAMHAYAACAETGGDGTTLGLSFGYSHKQALSYFSGQPAETIRCHSRYLLGWDNVFPLFYGALYICWISYLWKDDYQRFGLTRWINLFPLLMILNDWLENAWQAKLANLFLETQSLTTFQTGMGSALTTFKWATVAVCYLIILLGIFYVVRRKIGQQGKG